MSREVETMPPILIALVEVTALCAAFWTTRNEARSGRKWLLRIAAVVVIFLGGAALAADPRASALVGQYTVYLGVPAIIIYLMAAKRAGRGAPRRRR
jgi:hypothetical protein